MAAAAETTGDPTCDTQSGYFWYFCTWTTPYYSGCCSVDPCREEPIGCPASATGELVPDAVVLTITSYVPSATVVITITAHHPSSASSTPSSSSSSTLPSSSAASPPTPGAGAPTTSPTISSTSAAGNDHNSGNGMALSVSALIGIVLACGVVAIFAALSACMWWGRRRRQKNEKQEQAEGELSSRGMDEELVPPGLESVFNPMAQSGPGSVFDRAEGRMAEGNNMLGFSPLGRGPRLSNLSNFSSGAHSSLVSPLMPGSSWGSGLPAGPPELDSTPKREDGAVLRRGGASELDSRPMAKEEPEGMLRATLNLTQQERETDTYANSWTRFQNVQL